MNTLYKLFHAFSHFDIGAFVKFLYGFFKPFDNSIVMKTWKLKMEKVVNWYLQSYTLLPVATTRMWWFDRFTPIKRNVSHNLVWM